MRRIPNILIVLLVLGTCRIGADENLIARRISITDPSGNVPLMVPAVLYSRLTRRVPLVVSGTGEKPHNTIVLEYGETLAVTLEEDSDILDRRVYPADLVDDPLALADEFESLAADWGPLLGLVEPDISEELEIRREELAGEVSFEQQLMTPYQATLWIPVAARQIIITDGDSGSSRWIWQWPLRFDIAWFFRENLGLIGSFRFEYGDHISFGSDIDSKPLSTTNLMLMPGVGLQVRTVGRISAEFGMTMLFGAVRVTANEDLNRPNLLAGESTWVFYPVLSLEPAIVWSPSDRWSVKFRLLELNLGFGGLQGSEGASYGTGENTIILNYLQIGAAYRW